MIPKIIHYCWMSNDPYPEKIQKCIDSWHKYLPDYEFVHWNYDRFPRGKSKWVDQAFDAHKYAFAADYIRLYALYNYGGIYLDTDVEVCKSFDSMLKLHTMICWESDMQGPEVAAFGVERHSDWIRLCLTQYDNSSFIISGCYDMRPLPGRIKTIIDGSNFSFQNIKSIQEAVEISEKCIIPIFPAVFFSPKSYSTGELKVTQDTFSIHHFSGSWIPKYQRWEATFWRNLGLDNINLLSKINNNIHGRGRLINKIMNFLRIKKR